MTADILDRLRDLDTCALSDALDALGIEGAISGILCLSGTGPVAGRALTVTLRAGPAPADAPKVHLGARAIARGGADSVIVVDHPSIDAGGWGGVLSNAAHEAGIAGTIVNGPSRDIDEARVLGYPVFARGATARTARGRLHEAATGEAIVLQGVTVCEGDYVLADRTAVVVVPQDRIEDVLRAAERIAAKERLMTEAINAGKPIMDVMGADYEDMLDQMK